MAVKKLKSQQVLTKLRKIPSYQSFEMKRQLQNDSIVKYQIFLYESRL